MRWRKYQGALVQCVRKHYWLGVNRLGVTRPAESTATESTVKPSESPVLIADWVSETPVISDNGRLFGILCEPKEGTQSRPSVVSSTRARPIG